MKVTDINPITGKKGTRYQVKGEKVYEKFATTYINGIMVVVSSLGTFYKQVAKNDFVEMKSTLSKGFLSTAIRNETNKTVEKVLNHRMVAKLFVPQTKKDIDKGRVLIYIKDGEKLNIRPENLMWVNKKEMSRINAFKKEYESFSEKNKHNMKANDIVETNQVKAFLLDTDNYTATDIIKLLQLEKVNDIKEAINAKKKELSKLKK